MNGINRASLRVLRCSYHVSNPLRLSDCVKRSPSTNYLHYVVARRRPHTAAVWGYWGHSTALISLRNSSNQSGTHLSNTEVKKAVDNISEQFSEAMELLNDARSSSGTIYFSEDMEDAWTQVTDTLQDYTSLLEKLNEEQRRRVIQSVGLKMEELKTQMSLLEELAKE